MRIRIAGALRTAALRRFLVALGAASLAPMAMAQQPLDCPLRDAPFSVDSPLIDVLLSADAMSALRQAWPGARELSPWLAGTEAPTFSAIVTLRSMAGQAGFPPLDKLEAQLRAVPVTTADRLARCKRYDNDLPRVSVPAGAIKLLVFEKITGFKDAPSVDAAHAALKTMGERRGWSVTFTDKGGAMTAGLLKQFDAVVWNNVSGDVLTLSQRAAFRQYIEAGGAFVGFHGSSGDPEVFWDWYADTLIGARFKGHPMNPQFQDARIVIEDKTSPVVAGLAGGWTLNDEWYSFKDNPRSHGAHVLATLDERSYAPAGLAMGDHPIAWTRCVGSGRSFYSAIGHRPETYSDASHLRLLEQAIEWAADKAKTACR